MEAILYTVINRDDLPRDDNVFEFEGLRFSNTEVSFIWVDMPPGGTIRLHRHPYQKIFIVQAGVSTFVVGSTTMDAHAGQIILVPADVPHKFTNAGNTRLKQIDIHVSKQFITDWLEN
jgi:mannose-6-phosphate isomerase-like protein (cupin superfamily)